MKPVSVRFYFFMLVVFISLIFINKDGFWLLPAAVMLAILIYGYKVNRMNKE